MTISNLGLVALQQKDYVLAHDYFERSLVVRREIGDQRGISASLTNLGLVSMGNEQYQSAVEYFEQSTAMTRERGDSFWLSIVLTDLAFAYLKLEQTIEARKALCENLQLGIENSNPRTKLAGLGVGVALWLKRGLSKDAVAWASLIVHHPAAIQDNHGIIEELHPALTAALSPEEFAAAWELGKTLDLDNVTSAILSELTS